MTDNRLTKIENFRYVPCELSEINVGDKLAVGVPSREPSVVMLVTETSPNVIHAQLEQPDESGFQNFLFEIGKSCVMCWAIRTANSHTGYRYRIFGKVQEGSK